MNGVCFRLSLAKTYDVQFCKENRDSVPNLVATVGMSQRGQW